MPNSKYSPQNPQGLKISVLTVSDLHQSAGLYAELSQAVARHQPDMVGVLGDCLHAGEDIDDRLSVAECAKQLSSLPAKEIVFVRGNHEDMNWFEFADSWPTKTHPLFTLNGEVFKQGPFCMVGFPCHMGDEMALTATKGEIPPEPDDWLKPLLRLQGRAIRTLWLMHEPPVETTLSDGHSVAAGNPFGNEAVAF